MQIDKLVEKTKESISKTGTAFCGFIFGNQSFSTEIGVITVYIGPSSLMARTKTSYRISFRLNGKPIAKAKLISKLQ